MSGCLKKEILMAFADGELPPGEMKLTERHIEVCASCRRELAGIRATNATVHALLSSLAPEEVADASPAAFISVPYKVPNARRRWTAVVSMSVLAATLFLFLVNHRQHSAPVPTVAKTLARVPAPAVEKKDVLAAAVTKPVHVVVPKSDLKVRRFQALDDGEPIQTGMIYRVSLPVPSTQKSSTTQSAKRIPAEVIVDEFGNVRAIRFLQ
jgi:anti-sigma factor RsiW